MKNEIKTNKTESKLLKLKLLSTNIKTKLNKGTNTINSEVMLTDGYRRHTSSLC